MENNYICNCTSPEYHKPIKDNIIEFNDFKYIENKGSDEIYRHRSLNIFLIISKDNDYIITDSLNHEKAKYFKYSERNICYFLKQGVDIIEQTIRLNYERINN